MATEFYFYIVLGPILLLVSIILLITILVQFRLRQQYSIFCVKFGVDVITATSLIVLACLDRERNESECGATLVISTSIPLLQVLLLLCEVIDWSLAAFSPVYFHKSSLLSRILPFIAGAVCSTVILTALVMIDATTNSSSCVDSPEATAVISAYDFSAAIATVCVVTLGVLLCRKLNTSVFRPVAFHFVATLVLQEVPLITCIALKYGNEKRAVMAADVTNWLFCLHSLAHSIYFVYNHQDCREGLKATFVHCRVVAHFAS
ncbi:unnamed protein product [Caenorhabditis auriculariae]|uniref:Uncharacterized protein n=1 Tax=Caenorhabditis auriculariae TaxID=2777116 RepID=A0A8S1HID7_9PELO|nr:unnamed protein product [Caenorhabditis auriculariae]